MARMTNYLRTRNRLLVTAVSACFAAGTYALPTDPTVVNGSASFAQAGNVLTVTNSNGAILNWNTFSIGANETTRFIQPSVSSSVLNRVLADPSVILGSLTSNGRVFLINPNGIYVGQGARVDVAGFVASTLNISNANFLANKLTFDATPNAGSVVNQGSITTPSGGTVYLVAPNVSNEGIITTPHGETILAAGQRVTLLDTATPGVSVEITGADGNATNLGSVVADAGRIGIAGVLVKNSGTLNASSVVKDGGRIFLKASQDVYVDGGSRIVATGSKGGTVDVLGNKVVVTDRASIDASGTNGGGAVLIGGDAHGANLDVQNSSVTYFGPNATIKADSTDTGNGGKVIIWADDTTRAYGSISARGGQNGGDGGFIETSGKAYLDVNGIKVDARAPLGQTGTWLLDPRDIIVENSGGAPYTDVNTSSAQAGYALTISPTTLDATGATVVLQASHDINFRSPLTLTTPGAGVTATAGNALVIESGSGITTNNGAVALTGASILNFAGVHSGGGNIDLTATSGSIESPGLLDFGIGQLTLTNSASGFIGAQALSGSGLINATSGGSISLNAVPGSGLTLDVISGYSVDITTSGVSGAINADSAGSSVTATAAYAYNNRVTLNAGASIGSAATPLEVKAKHIGITTPSSFNVAAPTVTNLDLTVTAAGLGASSISGVNLGIGGLSLSNVVGTAVANLSGGSLNSLDLHVTGPLNLAALSGVGFIHATADSDITLGSVLAGNVSITSGGNINAVAEDTNYELDVANGVYLQAAGHIGGDGAHHLDIKAPSSITLDADAAVGAGAGYSVRTTSTGSLTVVAGTTFNIENTDTPGGATPISYGDISLSMRAAGMGHGSSIKSANFIPGVFNPDSDAATVNLGVALNSVSVGNLELAVSDGNLSSSSFSTASLGSLSLTASGSVTLGYVDISNAGLDISGNGVALDGIHAGSIFINSGSDVTLSSGEGSVASNGNINVFASGGISAAYGVNSTTGFISLHADNGSISTGYLTGYSVDLFAGHGNINVGNITANDYLGHVHLESHNDGGPGDISVGDVDLGYWGIFTAWAPDGALSMGNLWGYGGASNINNANIATRDAFSVGAGSSMLASNLSIHTSNGNIDLTPGYVRANSADLSAGGGGYIFAGLVGTSNLSLATSGGFDVSSSNSLNNLSISGTANAIGGYHDGVMVGYSYLNTPGQSFDFGNAAGDAELYISSISTPLNLAVSVSDAGIYAGTVETGGGALKLAAVNDIRVGHISTLGSYGFGAPVSLSSSSGSILNSGGYGNIYVGTAPVTLAADQGSVGTAAGGSLNVHSNDTLSQLTIWARDEVNVDVGTYSALAEGYVAGRISTFNIGVNGSGSGAINIAALEVPTITRSGGDLEIAAIASTTTLKNFAVVGRDGNLIVNGVGAGNLDDLSLYTAGNLIVKGDISVGYDTLELAAGVSTSIIVDGYGPGDPQLVEAFDRPGDVLIGGYSLSSASEMRISAGRDIIQGSGSVITSGYGVSLIAAHDVKIAGSVTAGASIYSGNGLYIAAGADPLSGRYSSPVSSGLGGDVYIGNGTDIASVSSTNIYSGLSINAYAGSGGIGGSIHIAELGSVAADGYYFLNIRADRNVDIQGGVTSNDGDVLIHAGGGYAGSFGGNITIGATGNVQALAGSGHVNLRALAGSVADTGNITQAAGSNVGGYDIAFEADRNIDISGGVYSYRGVKLEAGVGASFWNGSEFSGAPGGSIHVRSSGNVTTGCGYSYCNGVMLLARTGTDGAATGSIDLDAGSGLNAVRLALIADRDIKANGSIYGNYGVGMFAGRNISVGDGVTPDSGKIEALHGSISAVGGSYAYLSGSHVNSALEDGFFQSPSGGNVDINSGANLHAADRVGLYAFGTASGGGNIKTHGGSVLLADGVNFTPFSSVDLIGARDVTVDGDVTSNKHHVYIAAGQNSSSFPPPEAVASGFGGDVSVGGSIKANNSSWGYGGVAIRALADPALAYTDSSNAKGNIALSGSLTAGAGSFVDVSAGGDIHVSGSASGYEVVIAAGVSEPHDYGPYEGLDTPVSGRGGNVFLEGGSVLTGGYDVHVYASTGTGSTSSQVHGGNITQDSGSSIEVMGDEFGYGYVYISGARDVTVNGSIANHATNSSSYEWIGAGHHNHNGSGYNAYGGTLVMGETAHIVSDGAAEIKLYGYTGYTSGTAVHDGSIAFRDGAYVHGDVIKVRATGDITIGTSPTVSTGNVDIGGFTGPASGAVYFKAGFNNNNGYASISGGDITLNKSAQISSGYVDLYAGSDYFTGLKGNITQYNGSSIDAGNNIGIFADGNISIDGGFGSLTTPGRIEIFSGIQNWHHASAVGYSEGHAGHNSQFGGDIVLGAGSSITAGYVEMVANRGWGGGLGIGSGNISQDASGLLHTTSGYSGWGLAASAAGNIGLKGTTLVDGGMTAGLQSGYDSPSSTSNAYPGKKISIGAFSAPGSLLYLYSSGAIETDATNPLTAGITVASIDAQATTGITLTGATNAIGSLSASNSTSGNIDVSNNGALSLSAITATAGAITIKATGGLTLTGAISSDASGDAVNLVGSGFNNSAGSIATPNGRWLVWTADPASITGLGGLVEGFRQYGAVYGTTAPVAAGDGLNGLLFSDPGAITATLAGTLSKVYDSTVAATGLTLAGSSIYGDSITSSAPLNYLDKNVGTGKAINPASVMVTVTNGSVPVYGYTLTAPTVGGDITAASLALSGITAANKVYDATTAATVSTAGAIYTGLYSGDVVSVTASGVFSDKNVATGKTVTLSSSYTGADNGNYIITDQATTSADITVASLILNAVTDSKVYDGNTISAGTVSYSGLQGSDSAGSLVQSFDATHAGSRTLSVTSYTITDGNGGNNYTVTSNTAAGSITPKLLGSTAVISGTTTKPYDGTTVATGALVSGSVTGAISGDVLALDSSGLTVAYNNAHVASATSIVATGSAGITLSSSVAGSLVSDYSLTSPTISAVAASITPAVLTVSGNWSSPSSWIGGVLPENTDILGVLIASSVVAFDGTGGPTAVPYLTSASKFSMTGGALTVAGALTTVDYAQTGGALTAASVNITSTGSISQSAGSLTTPGLTTVSVGGTTLNGANVIGNIQASNSGSGNISLTNTGALSIAGISNDAGNIVISNAGTVSLNESEVYTSTGTVTLDVLNASSLTLDNSSGIHGNQGVFIGASGVSLNHASTIQTGPVTTANVEMVISGGDLTLDNGSSIIAGNDAIFTLTGANAQVVLNSAPDEAPSTIKTKYTDETTHINFLSRTSGGIVIDGAPGMVTTSGGSGFYALGIPATVGNGIDIIYPSASASDSDSNIATVVIDQYFAGITEVASGGLGTDETSEDEHDQDSGNTEGNGNEQQQQSNVGQCT